MASGEWSPCTHFRAKVVRVCINISIAQKARDHEVRSEHIEDRVVSFISRETASCEVVGGIWKSLLLSAGYSEAGDGAFQGGFGSGEVYVFLA